MSASDELFQLVHSLSKNEKRYFRRFVSQYSDKGSNNYLRLFDAVLKQSVFDQNKLLRKFRNDDFVKHFSSVKSYLFKLILRSMRAYRAEKNALIQIRELQTNSEILEEKGLFKQALKQIRKARKIGEDHELHLPLLDILQKEKWLVKKVWKKSAEKESEAIVKVINSSFDHLVREIQYGVVFDRFYYAQEKMDTTTDVNEHLQRMVKTTFEDHVEGSFHSRHLEYQIRGFYHHLRKEYKEAHGYHLRTRELWEAHPKLISLHPGKYRQVLRNCLQNHSYQGEEDLFEEIVGQISGLPVAAPEVEFPIQRDLLFTQLLFYLNAGKFAKGLSLAPQVEAFLREFSEQLTDLWTLSFYYNLCLVHLVLEQPSGALKWANAIINYERSQVRADIQYGARIIRLLVHFDLGNYDVLDYLDRSTMDYCSKDPGYKALARIVVRCLREQLASASVEPDRFLAAAEEVRAAELEKLQGHLAILIWLDSRGSEQSLTETARTRLARA